MFDVSFTELMVIGVVALIVIGPERLPKVARTVGHLLGRAQRYVSDVKSDIRREIELDDLRKLKTEMDEAAREVRSGLTQTEASLRRPAEALRDVLSQTAREANNGVDAPLPDSRTEAEALEGKTSAAAATAAGTPSVQTPHAAPATATPTEPPAAPTDTGPRP